MDGAGGGRGVVVERRREEEDLGRNLCYLLGVQTPSLTKAANFKASQTPASEVGSFYFL